MKILILEDDLKIQELLKIYLQQEGHDVSFFSYAEEALKALEKDEYDLLISDLMLPGMQGESFLSHVRSKRNIYIIVISAKDAITKKLELLKEGVDDYLTKPFSFEELMYKVRNIEVRRSREKLYRFNFNGTRYTLFPSKRVVRVNQKDVELNYREIVVLKYLIEHRGQILSRNQIIEGCLDKSEAFDRIIDTYVKTLRNKLNNKDIIETVYGEGYMFLGDIDG